MRIKALGCSGGQSPNIFTTCFRVDQKFVVDAGALCLNLDLEEQKKLEFVLITHTHIDHIKDLAFY